MNTHPHEQFIPKYASVIKGYVKRRPRLRNQLIRMRELWHHLRYLFLIAGSKPEQKAAEVAMPALRHFTRGTCSIASEMKAEFRDYTDTVSYEGMPISFEVACFLWSLCQATAPKRILDMGSGFSSFVFRRYQSYASLRPEVWSVDESGEWLEKTGDFLRSRNLTDDHLYTWDDFQTLEPGRFDLISHDLGYMTDRPDIFERLLELKNPDGVIIVDDLHNAQYRTDITHRLQRYELHAGYSMRWLTIDKSLRYSLLVR